MSGLPVDAPTVPCATDPERMFPTAHAPKERAAQEARAKAVCAPCWFRDRCLAWALGAAFEGVWGGTTEKEREEMRAKHGITAARVTFGSGVAGWGPEPHGTAARYRRHLRDGEKACGPCLDAQNRNRHPENNSRRAS